MSVPAHTLALFCATAGEAKVGSFAFKTAGIWQPAVTPPSTPQQAPSRLAVNTHHRRCRMREPHSRITQASYKLVLVLPCNAQKLAVTYQKQPVRHLQQSEANLLPHTQGSQRVIHLAFHIDSVKRCCEDCRHTGSPGHISTDAVTLMPLLESMAAATAAPRISLMAAFPRGALNAPFDAAAVTGCGVMEWACCNSAKPGG